MDQDDPEKRIAEREGRVVRQTPSADLPPTDAFAVRAPASAPIRCLLHQYPPKLRKHPLAVEFGPDQVSIIDPKTDALIASGSRAQVTATPAAFDSDITSDKVATTMPVLIMGVPGQQPLTIGCFEPRVVDSRCHAWPAPLSRSGPVSGEFCGFGGAAGCRG